MVRRAALAANGVGMVSIGAIQVRAGRLYSIVSSFVLFSFSALSSAAAPTKLPLVLAAKFGRGAAPLKSEIGGSTSARRRQVPKAPHQGPGGSALARPQVTSIKLLE